MIDPVNTTHHDGIACETCGEQADRGPRILGRQNPVPLCSDCYDDLTTICAGSCERRIWQAAGVRLFGASLHCRDCARPWLTAQSTKALKRDEARDDFEQRRR